MFIHLSYCACIQFDSCIFFWFFDFCCFVLIQTQSNLFVNHFTSFNTIYIRINKHIISVLLIRSIFRSQAPKRAHTRRKRERMNEWIKSEMNNHKLDIEMRNSTMGFIGSPWEKTINQTLIELYGTFIARTGKKLVLIGELLQFFSPSKKNVKRTYQEIRTYKLYNDIHKFIWGGVHRFQSGYWTIINSSYMSSLFVWY